ncbi:unnamed protein product [Cylindrotheca closterium]|uniref:N-acetylgalactosaminide beta-1,3-galactosyltransferase n=1 Tax=Cylindrotheca closterium TaxID=2856 RepID=A0AAD2G491_9STRA|nr:unnamed protein product [Cylindrotheca closterium]
MVRKGLFGYLGLCCLVGLYFFGNSRKLNGYGASKRETSHDISASDSKLESTLHDNSSQHKVNIRVLYNVSEYTNASSSLSSSASSANAAYPNLFDGKEYTTTLNPADHTNTSSMASYLANNQSLLENREDFTETNSSEYTTTTASSSSSSSSPSPPHHASTRSIQSNNSANNIYYLNGTYAVVNPWYGWQPEPHAMDCSWEECKVNDHTCKYCRDSWEEFYADVPNISSIDPGKDWIPDVTMLRRMYLDGYDANGNPWPPPLDDELCQLMGNTSSKELLDVVPITAPPMPRRSEPEGNRVLCMIYTMEKKHHTAIRVMRETWAPGCDGFLAFSTKSDPRIPAISVNHMGREKYGNMWQKVISMNMFVGQHYISQFDWFYIGGDDLVAFPQNLKNYLARFNSSEAHYIGRRFKFDEVGFNTGGAGYALSRPSLQCLVDHRIDSRCMPWKASAQEDVLTGRCLKHACNITYTDTRDEQLRERFHHFGPQLLYIYKGKIPWYRKYNKEWGVLSGKDCCSPETINFHYIKNPATVRFLHHYVHNCNRTIQ